MTDLLQASGIKLDHATVQHARNIVLIERSHQKLKQILKINITADKSQWDRYINKTVMAQNTTCHQSIKCTPIGLLHGRVPHNALDLKLSKPRKPLYKTDLETSVGGVNQKHKENVSNTFQALHKYKNYSDQKTTSVTPNQTKPSSRHSSGTVHIKSWKNSHTQITLHAKLAPKRSNASIACISASSSHTRMSGIFKWLSHSFTPIPLWSISQTSFTVKHLR